MLQKIIDAIVAFFKGPQPAPVIVAAPYKLEVPATLTITDIAKEAVVVTEVTTPVKQARKPAVKKTAEKAPVPTKKVSKKPAAIKAPAKIVKKPVAKK